MDLQLRKLLGSEDDFAVFMRRQLDWLLEANTGGGTGNQALHRMIGGVVQLGVDGQVGRVERLIEKMSDGQRLAQSYGAGR